MFVKHISPIYKNKTNKNDTKMQDGPRTDLEVLKCFHFTMLYNFKAIRKIRMDFNFTNAFM